jgi:hypothetical protein
MSVLIVFGSAVTLDMADCGLPPRLMLRCRALGHRYRFSSDGPTMRWDCERGCGAGGSKRYASAADAARYARAFDREDRRELGRRTPVGLLPLRILRWLRRKSREDRGHHDDEHVLPR